MENDRKEPEAKEGFFERMWRKFGEVAKRLGLVSDSDIEEALAKQQSGRPGKRIGEILVEDEKITMDHVDKVLKDQKKSSKSRKKAVKTTAKKAAKKKAVKTTVKKAAGKKAGKATAKKTAKKKAVKTTVKKAARKNASGSKKR